MTRRLTAQQVQERLAARGLDWTGGKYQNSRSQLTVKCEAGHTFTAQAQSLLYDKHNTGGNACRECDMTRRFGPPEQRGPKPRTRDRRTTTSRRNYVWIEYYNGASWIPTEVRDTVNTKDLDDAYGKNNWRLM